MYCILINISRIVALLILLLVEQWLLHHTIITLINFGTIANTVMDTINIHECTGMNEGILQKFKIYIGISRNVGIDFLACSYLNVILLPNNNCERNFLSRKDMIEPNSCLMRSDFPACELVSKRILDKVPAFRLNVFQIILSPEKSYKVSSY